MSAAGRSEAAFTGAAGCAAAGVGFGARRRYRRTRRIGRAARFRFGHFGRCGGGCRRLPAQAVGVFRPRRGSQDRATRHSAPVRRSDAGFAAGLARAPCRSRLPSRSPVWRSVQAGAAFVTAGGGTWPQGRSAAQPRYAPPAAAVTQPVASSTARILVFIRPTPEARLESKACAPAIGANGQKSSQKQPICWNPGGAGHRAGTVLVLGKGPDSSRDSTEATENPLAAQGIAVAL